MDYKDLQAGLDKELFWFKGKNNFIDILLSKNLNNKNLKILDIGSGTGDDLNIINKYGNTFVIDINQEALDLIPNNLIHEKKVGDITNISYPDNYFDLVLIFDVLEHIENDQKALEEIKRVLKPGAILMFTVPAFNFLYNKHDKYLGHFRRYSKKNLKNLINNDFEIITLSYWMNLLFIPALIQRKILNFFYFKKNLELKSNLINKIFYKILSFENFCIKKGVKFPYGLTLYGVCKVKK